MELVERIGRAIERITSGQALMRVPVDETDPDTVLVDCEKEITRLRAKVEELREKYEELLFCVEQKHPYETRHETAKRLIESAYNRTGGPCASLNDARKGEGDNDGKA